MHDSTKQELARVFKLSYLFDGVIKLIGDLGNLIFFVAAAIDIQIALRKGLNLVFKFVQGAKTANNHNVQNHQKKQKEKGDNNDIFGGFGLIHALKDKNCMVAFDEKKSAFMVFEDTKAFVFFFFA